MSETSEPIPDAVPTRPWRAEDGRPPVVWTWPSSDPPVLWVLSGGRWRYATVMAKQVWADGTVHYQVSVDLLGDTAVSARLYRWPQPGLRVARRSRYEPTTGVDTAHEGDMPRKLRRAVAGPPSGAATGSSPRAPQTGGRRRAGRR